MFDGPGMVTETGTRTCTDEDDDGTGCTVV